MTDVIVSFLIAVAAGVVCHLVCVCKWLDSKDNDNQPKKKTLGVPSGDFRLVYI